MNLSRLFLSAVAGVSILGASAFSQSRTIVIDAGHGGYDRGGVPGQRISEKDKTLDVAQRLKRLLQAEGYRVVMTRDSDVFVSLGARVSIAAPPLSRSISIAQRAPVRTESRLIIIAATAPASPKAFIATSSPARRPRIAESGAAVFMCCGAPLSHRSWWSAGS